MIAILVVLLGLIGAGRAAGSRVAAWRYFGDDPSELALARAVADGDPDRIARLVAGGTDADAVGADFITMAQWAVESRSPRGLEALLAAGALPDRLGRAGRAPLHDAARLRNPRYAAILLDAGADPNVRVAFTRTTPLREACLASAPATFEVLVAGHAELEATDALGDRALHICGRTNAGALVLRLLELGADPEARDASDNTFQDYYFSYDDALQSHTARLRHRDTARWLVGHRVRLVPRAEHYR